MNGKGALICSLFFIGMIYYKKPNKKMFLILSSITFILFFNYNLKTIDRLIEKKEYEFQIDTVSDYSKIIKVDNRYLKTNYFLSIDSCLEDGSYKILGRVEKIENNIVNLKVINQIEINHPIKTNLNNQVENLVSPFPYKFQNFTKAVLLGRKDVITTDIRNKFNYTGTSHILVISGLHIGIIIFTILFLLKNLPYQIRYSLASIILTLYCYGVGFTPSVLRAYIMGILFLGAKLFYEEREMKKALMIAFIVSSFINPYGIRSISYQMSYLALIGILFLYPKIKELFSGIVPKKLSKFKAIDFLILSFSIQLILTPLFLYNFRVLPLFSFLPNLIVIPLGSILVQILFIGLLLSFIGLGNLIMPLGYQLYLLLIFIIDRFYSIPFLTLTFYTKISLFLYIFLYVIIFLIIIFKRESILRYWYITFFIIPLIFLNIIQRKENLDLKLGYYRNTPNRVLILNKKPNKKDIFLLKDAKIHKLDYIITTFDIKNSELENLYSDSINIVLKVGEGIDLNNEMFINEKNKIIIKVNYEKK
jgi:competence protein ComEC